MPRPAKSKSQSFTVYLRRDSQVYADFLADTETSPIGHLPGTLIAVRLGEYYDAVREGRILPKGRVAQGQGATSTRKASLPEINQEELSYLLDRPDVITGGDEVADSDLAFFEDEDENEE